MKITSDDLFGLLLLVLLALILGALAFVAIPKDNMELFTALASGVIGSGVGTWIGYRWGASKNPHAAPQDPQTPPPAA